jgi:hypothetical protein
MKKKLATYQQANRKATDWLLGFANPDGSIGPVEDHLYYYRLPWALVQMGEITASNRLLDWIRRHMFTSQGAFEGVSPQGVFQTRYGSYPLACLLVGATLMQRFDLIYPGTRHLLTWQDPESGGFYNNRQDTGPTSQQELFPAAQGGMSLLLVGQLEAARKAGEFLARLWALQPDVEHRLYHVYSPTQGLVTDYPAEDEAFYLTRKDDPYQHHFNGGIAAALLAKLYMATGEARWLELAQHYQDFSMTTHPCQFQSMQTCKSGWGSGLLYMVTREARYRDWTVRLGDWFVEHQTEDGHWENTRHWTPDPTLADNIHITAEFVMHLGHIIAYLSV